MDFRWDIIIEYAPFLLKGTLLTIGLSIASILMGTFLGLLIGLGKIMRNKVLLFHFIVILLYFEEHPYYFKSL